MIAEKNLSRLLTDLDCDGYGIRRCKELHATNLVEIDHAALSDARPILDGTVTDLSVKAAPVPPPPPPPWEPDIPPPQPPEDERIAQSKLNLNGTLPLGFITAPEDADGDMFHGVPGDKYQPASEKGQNSGYASLDGNKRIPSSQIPLAGTGTLKELLLGSPNELSFVPPLSPVAGVISLTGNWSSAPKVSWFGNPSAADDARPRFQLGTIPVSLIPNLDTSKVTSGVLSRFTLKVAVGVGSEHAPGAVPDPGKLGEPTDYLGRDMQWHAMVAVIAYQPSLKPPTITVIGFESDNARVTVTSSDKGTCFYRIAPMTLFTQFTATVELPPGQTIEAYAVKVGYNNSPIVYFTNTA